MKTISNRWNRWMNQREFDGWCYGLSRKEEYLCVLPILACVAVSAALAVLIGS